MLLRFSPQYCSTPIPIHRSRSNLYHRSPDFNRLSILTSPNLRTPNNPISTKHPQVPIFKCKNQSVVTSHHVGDYSDPVNTSQDEILIGTQEPGKGKSFWAAVSLIIGTAVGPGMLGLPAATIRSGSVPSTLTILVCWMYVISSIILVAELSFAAMEEDNAAEVSFTGLATKALGRKLGAFVALVYACLSFSLLVACVSGIGSIVSQWFPSMNVVLAHSFFPLCAGIVIGFFPFKATDALNRSLCFLMLFSITSLVAIGLSVARTNVVASFGYSSWRIVSILPSVPVIVLTLGFHVITPFICKIVGSSVSDARKAILAGGVVPLCMVLSWNLIVLGLARINPSLAMKSLDPISLLLSVNPSALTAVQGFAFSALATSLIGYVVSFPKQLVDTLKLVFGDFHLAEQKESNFQTVSDTESDSIRGVVMPFVLGVPILLASFFPSIFSRALDFAGIYANCFLFGILPPVMAYVQQSKKKLRSSVLPGGNFSLLILFGIAVILGIWH